jgi:hypothetical protein
MDTNLAHTGLLALGVGLTIGKRKWSLSTLVRKYANHVKMTHQKHHLEVGGIEDDRH